MLRSALLTSPLLLLAAPSRAAEPAPAAPPPWTDVLIPDSVSLIAGSAFPVFLMYEFPGPMVGVEVGWRLSRVAELIVSANLNVVWATGSQRYLIPLALNVRATPWEVGPWIQIGVGTTPFFEHIGIDLPERDVDITDAGATMTVTAKLGVDICGWDIGLGYEHNLLPSPFYEHYKGSETLPWTGTLSAWIGIPIWTRSAR